MNFEEMLAARTQEAEDVLKKYLPKKEGFQEKVLEAMHYSIFAGGKRLRPVLMKESYVLFGGQSKIVEPFMAALEMIHNYSLVHDDLPDMDNDAYRRGRETTWRVYGAGMAVLAGDALLNYAFETAGRAFSMIGRVSGYTDGQGHAEDALHLYEAVGQALQILAQKAGVYGMVGGQCADLCAEGLPAEEVTDALLLYIHKNKTAALIEAAMMIGALLAGADAAFVSVMEKVAQNVGMAFQIQDDILDVTGSTEVLGKQTGSDEKNQKVTYVSLNGLEQARKDVRRMSEEAMEGLRALPVRSPFLEELIRNLITREK